jgi:hypothetical protein
LVQRPIATLARVRRKNDRAVAEAGFPPRRSGFETGSSHVRSVVNRAALGQVFSEHVRFDIFTAVTMKKAVFWDVNRVAVVRIQQPQAVTSQKTTFFIVTAVITSNLT